MSEEKKEIETLEKKIEKRQKDYKNDCDPYTPQSSGFVGLENQGSTCYLNSILQNLFLTPEIRTNFFKLSPEELKIELLKEISKEDKSSEDEIDPGVFKEMGFNMNAIKAAFEKVGKSKSQQPELINWLITHGSDYPEEKEEKKDDDEKKQKKKKPKKIPIQLQSIFTRLQTVELPFIGTEDLTKSFGWEHNQVVYQQHDVQELNRVLFDVLEKSLKSTSQKNLIPSLYKGALVTKVICKECGHTSEIKEDFLDLTVLVKDTANVKESLGKYVESELLTGDNKYSCDTCNKKVEASKFVRIRKLPKILILSLSRFDFDWNKGRRFKIESKFEYPMTMDVKDYLEDSVENKKLKDNDTKYELFSVVIHGGSAHGGHYHAYIKDILGNGKSKNPKGEKNVWYDFNDKYVYPMEEDEITSQCGGEKKDESAYMLVYRCKNMGDTTKLDFAVPNHLKKDIAEENEKAKKEKKDYDLKMANYSVHLYLAPAFKVYGERLVQSSENNTCYKFCNVPRKSKVSDLREYFKKEFKMPSDFRLYCLDKYGSISGPDTFKFDSVIRDETLLLKESRYFYNDTHILASDFKSLTQMKLLNEDGTTSLQIKLFKSKNDTDSKQIDIPSNISFTDLKVVLEKYFKIDPKNQIIHKLEYSSKPELIEYKDVEIPLLVSGLLDGIGISIQDSTSLKENEKPFVIQRWDAEQSQIEIYVRDKVSPKSTTTDDETGILRIKVVKDWKVSEVKKYILKKISEAKKLDSFNPKNIKLKKYDYVKSVLEDESKTLGDYEIDDYDKIFIEETLQQDYYTLYFRKISYRGAGKPYEFKFKSDMTVKECKKIVCEKLNDLLISVHDFRLRLEGFQLDSCGTPIMDEDVKIGELSLREGDSIYMEVGACPVEDMITLKVQGCEWPPEVHSSTVTSNSFELYRWLRCSKHLTLREFKMKLLKAVDEVKKITDIELIRVRTALYDCGYKRVGNAYTFKDYDKTLDQLHWKEDLDVCVQMLKSIDPYQLDLKKRKEKKEKSSDDKLNLEEIEKLTSGVPTYITLRKRVSDKDEFSEGIEYPFSSKELSSVSSLKDAIKKLKGYENIQTVNMLLVKYNFLKSTWRIILDDDVIPSKDEKKQSLKEIYELNDGDILVVKDVTKDPNNKDIFYSHLDSDYLETTNTSSSSDTKKESESKTVVVHVSSGSEVRRDEREEQLKINYSDDEEDTPTPSENKKQIKYE